MRSRDALRMLNDMHSWHRYWLPEDADRVFLEDIDFDVRVGGMKTLPEARATRLKQIYKKAQEVTQ